MRPRALALFVICLVACVRQPGPRSPEEAFSALGQAARAADLGRLFELLDKGTRWSIMSVFKDQQQTCSLVRAHYPKDRQPRELRRCQLAAGAPDAKAFFVAYARKHHQAIVEPLARMTAVKARHGSGTRVELEIAGVRLPFCEEDGLWAYCGLHERFDRLKVKTARDLSMVRENIEAYR